MQFWAKIITLLSDRMSAATDEDVELRELLVSNLEARGVLSKIKAELRAAIFQCLDEKPPAGKWFKIKKNWIDKVSLTNFLIYTGVVELGQVEFEQD